MAGLFVSEFVLEQVVYLRTDSDQEPRIVVGVQFIPGGSIQYRLNCGACESWHYECELTGEKILLEAPSGAL